MLVSVWSVVALPWKSKQRMKIGSNSFQTKHRSLNRSNKERAEIQWSDKTQQNTVNTKESLLEIKTLPWNSSYSGSHCRYGLLSVYFNYSMCCESSHPCPSCLSVGCSDFYLKGLYRICLREVDLCKTAQLYFIRTRLFICYRQNKSTLSCPCTPLLQKQGHDTHWLSHPLAVRVVLKIPPATARRAGPTLLEVSNDKIIGVRLQVMCGLKKTCITSELMMFCQRFGNRAP